MVLRLAGFGFTGPLRLALLLGALGALLARFFTFARFRGFNLRRLVLAYWLSPCIIIVNLPSCCGGGEGGGTVSGARGKCSGAVGGTADWILRWFLGGRFGRRFRWPGRWPRCGLPCSVNGVTDVLVCAITLSAKDFFAASLQGLKLEYTRVTILEQAVGALLAVEPPLVIRASGSR